MRREIRIDGPTNNRPICDRLYELKLYGEAHRYHPLNTIFFLFTYDSFDVYRLCSFWTFPQFVFDNVIFAYSRVCIIDMYKY